MQVKLKSAHMNLRLGIEFILFRTVKGLIYCEKFLLNGIFMNAFEEWRNKNKNELHADIEKVQDTKD